MIPGIVNIDKNSPILGLDRSYRSNGTIAVCIGDSILGWTSKFIQPQL
jgi:hypothetical protein